MSWWVRVFSQSGITVFFFTDSDGEDLAFVVQAVVAT